MSWTQNRLLMTFVFIGLAAGGVTGCAFGLNVSRWGDYELTLTTDATEYSAGDPIVAVAELRYAGEQDTVSKSSLKGGPIGFGVRQLDGTIHTEPTWALQCEPVELQREQPLRQPFIKSGGWSHDDPNRTFYESFVADPQLRLPAGRWEVYAIVDLGPDGTNCQGEIVLRHSQHITVK